MVHPDSTVERATYDDRGLPKKITWIDPNGVEKSIATLTRSFAGLAVRRDTDYGQHREVGYDNLGRPVTDEVIDEYERLCALCPVQAPVRQSWTIAYTDSDDIARQDQGS